MSMGSFLVSPNAFCGLVVLLLDVNLFFKLPVDRTIGRIQILSILFQNRCYHFPFLALRGQPSAPFVDIYLSEKFLNGRLNLLISCSSWKVLSNNKCVLKLICLHLQLPVLPFWQTLSLLCPIYVLFVSHSLQLYICAQHQPLKRLSYLHSLLMCSPLSISFLQPLRNIVPHV